MACVLVVEDERNIRLLMTTIMHQIGHEVMEAADGQSALNILKQHLPDVVLTDLRMPQMTGVQLIAEVKERFPHLPIVVVSAFSDQIEKALQKGAENFLVKPFAKRQLVDVVNKTLEQPI
jgi:YesN/AraC family two-component response regulator